MSLAVHLLLTHRSQFISEKGSQAELCTQWFLSVRVVIEGGDGKSAGSLKGQTSLPCLSLSLLMHTQLAGCYSNLIPERGTRLPDVCVCSAGTSDVPFVPELLKRKGGCRNLVVSCEHLLDLGVPKCPAGVVSSYQVLASFTGPAF